MTPAQARTAMGMTFASGWGDTTPIVWENSLPTTPNTPFVRFSVQHKGAVAQSWSGEAMNRYDSGFATVEIFTRIGTGTALSDQLVDKVQQVLRGRQLAGGIDLHEAKVTDKGPDGRGWTVTQVDVRFVYRE